MFRQKSDRGKTTQIVGGLTLKGIIDALYPVNSLLMTTDNVNPGTRFTGTTWVAYAAGRALVGVGANGENTYTGGQSFGADAVTLTNAQSGVNQHTHTNGVQPSASPGWTSGISANHTHPMSILQKHATNTPNGNADNGGASTLQGGTTGRWNSAQSGVTSTVSSDHQHFVGTVEYTDNTLKPPAVTAHENRQKSIAVYVWQRTA